MAAVDQGVQRDLGGLETATKNLQTALERQGAEIAELRNDVHAIQVMLAEARGGWRTLMWLGGAGGLVGAVIGATLHAITNFFTGAPK